MKDFSYIAFKNMLDPTLYARYAQLKAQTDYKPDHDPLVGGANHCGYGDTLFDLLLEDLTPKVAQFLECELFPTYSYYRVYTKGATLAKHTDRPACEVSMTLCLDGAWPIFMDGEEVHQNPGDGCLYKGIEVLHWREPLENDTHTQLFLHWSTDESLKFDGRTGLGEPNAMGGGKFKVYS